MNIRYALDERWRVRMKQLKAALSFGAQIAFTRLECLFPPSHLADLLKRCFIDDNFLLRRARRILSSLEQN